MIAFATAELLERFAALVEAGLLETNLAQVYLADHMGMDLVEWIGKYGKRFREIYDSNVQLKTAVDTQMLDESKLSTFVELLKQGHPAHAATKEPCGKCGRTDYVDIRGKLCDACAFPKKARRSR